MNILNRFIGILFSLARVVFGILWMKSGIDKLSGGFGVEGLVPVVLYNTDSPQWYKQLFDSIVGPYASWFDIIIPWGEVLIGVGLLVGLFIIPALIVAVFLHVNYLLADMIYTYPTDVMCSVILLTGKRFTSYISLDRWILRYPFNIKKVVHLRK